MHEDRLCNQLCVEELLLGKVNLVFILFFVPAILGCRDTTFIGTEYLGNAPSSDGEPGAQTDANADTDNRTDIGIETDTPTEVSSDTDSTTDTVSDTDLVTECGVTDNFRWTSSEPTVFPPSGATSIKDPTVVRHGDNWLVYATAVVDPQPLTMTYLSFADWSEAGGAEQTPVSVNPNLSGYKAAPQLFYFSKDKLWYLIYQTQDPAYSTNTDPSNVGGWTPADVHALQLHGERQNGN